MNKKKLFSGISSAVLILGSLSPMQAFAQTEGETAFEETQAAAEVSTEETQFKRCQSAHWRIDNGTLIISGKLDSTYKLPGEWDWYNKYCNSIKKVEFAEGFTFSGSIGGMFGGMENLESIDFGNFPETSVTNMDSTFWKCRKLTHIDLSKFDTSQVENMKSLFNGCWKLESIDVSKFDTSNVKNMNATFAYCNSLKSLDLKKFDTSNVTTMKGMFSGCWSLESLDLTSFFTPKLTDMQGMFGQCTKLSTLNMSSFDTASVTDMENLFADCSALRELDLTSWAIDEKTNIKGMFVNSGLNTIHLTTSSSAVQPALGDLSATWHVQQTGPYPVGQIMAKTQEYADKGVKQVIVERFLDYKLTYNSLYEAAEMPAETKVASDTGNCTLTVTTQLPKRSGYAFLGWADTPDAAQAKYQAGNKVVLDLAKDGLHKDLYAVWRRNSNSSSGSSSSSNRVNLSSVHEMHRLYNPNSGEHFYTKETAERDHLVNVGWNYEGTAWYSPKSSSSPVYRLYNPNAGDHHYTLDAKEKDELVKLGWRYEGIGWYSASKSNGQAIHRQYNPNAVAGAHNFTTDENERDFLINNGWSHEGVAWYGVHPKNIKK